MSKIVRKFVDGFSWYLDVLDGGIGATLADGKTSGSDFEYCRESVFMQLINTTIKPGMVCIDLGANIGYATMFMLRNSGEKGFVYAIEPDAHNGRILVANIKENDFWNPNRIELSKCVISDTDGESSFWIANKPNLNSVRKTKHSIREEKIPCFSLSSFCENRRYPNFIKMDIEGHEVSVFRGGYEYFKKNRGTTHILLEIHPNFYNKENDFEEMLRKYFDIGFKCSYIVATPVPRPAFFQEKGYEPIEEIKTDGFTRGLYKDISDDDAIQISCRENLEPWGNGYTKKIARSMMISRIEE